MSQELINRSPDLKRLRDEGYDIDIRSGFLLVKDVPYVNKNKEVKRGILVSALRLAGDVTAAPDTHVAMFVGDYPCDKYGTEIDKIKHGAGQQLAPDLVVNFSFSSKPRDGYKDYHEKMTTYIAIFSSHAQSLDPTVTAKTFPTYVTKEEESVFNYLDTATSRAEISMVSRKLELSKIAIVGVGGTGSYILDLVAKTPVKEIHIFDEDDFLSHNAFRTPGAASVEKLREKLKKVYYFRELYSNMRRGIVVHPYSVDASNIIELKEMGFVFISIDSGEPKKVIVENLETYNIPFIDVGMDVERVEDSLNGVLRITTSKPSRRKHFQERVSLGAESAGDEYKSNIQIADLNALNAALAVVKWKKLFGFYQDFERENHSTYSIDCNSLTNDEQDETPDNTQA